MRNGGGSGPDRTGAAGDAEGASGGSRVGVLVSNLAFQAGSFDMASAEKFCKLLLRCAEDGCRWCASSRRAAC